MRHLATWGDILSEPILILVISFTESSIQFHFSNFLLNFDWNELKHLSDSEMSRRVSRYQFGHLFHVLEVSVLITRTLKWSLGWCNKGLFLLLEHKMKTSELGPNVFHFKDPPFVFVLSAARGATRCPWTRKRILFILFYFLCPGLTLSGSGRRMKQFGCFKLVDGAVLLYKEMWRDTRKHWIKEMN